MADDDTSSNKDADAVLDPNDESYVVESAQGSSSDDYEDPSDTEGLIAAALDMIKKAGDAHRKKAKKTGSVGAPKTPKQKKPAAAAKRSRATSEAIAGAHLIIVLRALNNDADNPQVRKSEQKKTLAESFDALIPKIVAVKAVKYIDDEGNEQDVQDIDWEPLALTGEKVQTKWAAIKKAQKAKDAEAVAATGISDDESTGDKVR